MTQANQKTPTSSSGQASASASGAPLPESSAGLVQIGLVEKQ